MIADEAPHIVVLIAAYNRRHLTVRALRSLFHCNISLKLSVVLFDDGSSDGTAEAVKSEWPETIVLQGNGDAFWNGGMHAAWHHALTLQADGYLWLNDDVTLDSDALSRLASEWHRHGGKTRPFIVVGATRAESGELTYGGQRQIFSPFALKFEKLPISNGWQHADTFNGNIVLISRATVEQIGINDPAYRHSLGDIDYGLRARRAGIDIIVPPGTFGICNANVPLLLDEMTVIKRWRKLTSFRGIPVKNWLKFTRRFSGIWFPIHFFAPYRKVFLRNRSSL